MPINRLQLNNTVLAYVSTFCSEVVVGEVEPASRNEMIQRCTDKLVKQQCYCVWRLLDYALRDCYGKGVKDFNLYQNERGKWICGNSGVHFSLAHCNNVVVVALCSVAVGVDVESVANFARHANDSRFAERILTANEQTALRNTPDCKRTELLAKMWTQKESAFKLQDRTSFVAKSFDTTKHAVNSRFLSIDGEQYALSVAARREGNATKPPVEIKHVKIEW